MVDQATEGRKDLSPGINTSVILRGRDVLVFDQVINNAGKKPKHWRQALTDEVFEIRDNDVTATCYVLDAFLLYASQDGVLRAHPRGNPKSTYHVEEAETLITQMTSLYNVVALIHSYDVLELRLVSRRSEDPFIQFPRVLYSDREVDSAHTPLLYGPYVLYASLDGNWYCVNYEAVKQKKERIQVPFTSDWQLVAIKNANWRYWTVVLKPPYKNTIEEYFLFRIIVAVNI